MYRNTIYVGMTQTSFSPIFLRGGVVCEQARVAPL